MQPVNDDMDPLFRRAAEEYPLNIEGADFDKLFQKMQQPGEAAPPAKEQKRQYSWLLLLLLLFPFVCRHYAGSSEEDQQPITAQTNTQAPDQNIDSSNQKNIASGNDTQPKSDNLNDGAKQATQPTSQQKVATGTNQQTQAKEPAIASSDKELDNTTNGTLANNKSRSSRKKATAATTDVANDKSWVVSTNNKKVKHIIGQNKEQISAATIVPVITRSSTKDSVAAGENLFAIEAGKDSASYADSDNEITAGKSDTAASALAKVHTAKDSTSTDSTIAVKKASEKNAKPRKYLYVGVVAGPDYSVVKSIQTAGTGYNAGLVAGYRFGRHWALETGFIWNFKKYYADGEYVSTDKLGLQPHSQVLNVDGSCGMFEIPLAVKYHFSSKSKGHWYAAAGVSSYLMKQEEYYYWYKRYNMQYYSKKEYTNSSKDWLSVLQLSGGYQWQLGKRGSLRAEPYLKLPISKIGIGQLPLSSAGINIGYTIPF